jgi:deazaflavin-dependent oxidoreductase (nitroreductase family)
VALTDRLARFNRRFANHAVVPVAGRRHSPVAVVRHRGRRSGKDYRTPVMVFPAGDRLLVALPYGARRDWVRNVLAAGGGTVERGGRRVTVADPMLVPARDVPAPLGPALRTLRIRQALRLTPVSDAV